ncbi:CBS domain-containing protein [Pedobacter frigidisoli]|uniref:CBS domain-containing protein n=1 Tax=Pedobacter frigidisoli TaxID=2530455 RepID=A0A4V2MMP4_9SPHI|nr:CBS domain-containing protein [Pedobacter frigidisoli]TCD07666.1 CBS domain-containing protein [Pedobacter frigidisoli]
MDITHLIDKDFHTVSVLEDTRDAKKWFLVHQYMAVIDENSIIIGIITQNDLLKNPESRQLLDVNFFKPIVELTQTLSEVFALMKQSQSDFLPVNHNDKFIGIITLLNLTQGFELAIKNNHQNYQKVIHDLRNPIDNMQGLVSVLDLSSTDDY